MTKSYYTSVLQPCATFSVILAGFVILTVLTFPSMIRHKIFMQIVTLISIADIMGNWPFTLGWYPANHTSLCTFEGFCNLLFFPASWLLTTMLTAVFRELVIYKKISTTLSFVAMISFGIPLLFTVLMFSFSKAPFDSANNSRSGTCSYNKNDKIAYMWHEVTYNGMYFGCVLWMLIALFQIVRYQPTVESEHITLALVKKILILYPFALIVCWTPHALCIYFESCYFSNTVFVRVTSIKNLHGGLVAIIFFTMSNEARQNWYQLCCKMCCKQCYKDSNDHDHDTHDKHDTHDDTLPPDMILSARMSMAMPTATDNSSSNTELSMYRHSEAAVNVTTTSHHLNRESSFFMRASNIIPNFATTASSTSVLASSRREPSNIVGVKPIIENSIQPRTTNVAIVNPMGVTPNPSLITTDQGNDAM